MKNLLVWLTQDANSAKHTSGWAHPIAACLTHYVISCFSIWLFHDAFLIPLFLKENDEIPPLGSLSLCPMEAKSSASGKSFWVACGSFIYAILLLIIRLTSNSPGIHRFAVLYELTWLCNAALLFGATFGLLTCRPRIATGFAIAVSIDQILWYVDVIGYTYNVLSKKKKMFPVGVCQYLIWPQTQWSAKITCTHHFWTIPLLVYGAGGIDWGSYIMNIVMVLVFVVLSRWLTPFGLKPISSAPNRMLREIADYNTPAKSRGAGTSEAPKQPAPIVSLGCLPPLGGSSSRQTKKNAKRPRFEKYLNVNLSHELWQDIKVPILRRHGDNQTMPVYILRLNLWWSFFNLLCFLLLKGIEIIIVTAWGSS